jgi:hypothetical protein
VRARRDRKKPLRLPPALVVTLVLGAAGTGAALAATAGCGSDQATCADAAPCPDGGLPET